MEKGRSREELRKAYDDLENKVAQRTAELAAAAQSLRESQKDLDRAQEVGQVGSWRLDVRRNVLTWSGETHRMFGIPKGTPLTYEKFMEAVHPEDRQSVETQWKAAALRGEPYDIEHRIVVGGQVKWVREKAYLEFDQTGTLLGGFGVARDITVRKRADERIRHDNAVLEGINRILHAALTGHTEEELGNRCLAVAEEVTRSRFGFLAEINAGGRLEVIAISDPGWEACHMDDSPGQRRLPAPFQIHGLFGRVILDGKGFYTNDPASHPDRIGAPEGHPPLKSFLGVPLKQDGKTIGMIAVANCEDGYRPQDLEAVEALAAAIAQVFLRRRAEQALREGEERLRQAQKMESIGVLAGGLAHDFNNLLVGVMGNASLLQDMLPAGSAEVTLLADIVKAGERAAHLTSQMLAYSGKGQFVVEPVNLSDLVREMMRLLQPSIPVKVAVHLELQPGLPLVQADVGQMQQVVMNLVLNAAEAIGDSAGLISVRTGARGVDGILPAPGDAELEPGTYVFLEVRDTGCGMTDATMARIFDPFFTTKFTGRGLGLAAAAGIVRGHKGAISVSGNPGKGSTFLVRFPAKAGTRPAETPRAPRAAELHGAGTVLVVDDEAVVLKMAKMALEQHGYTVLHAGSGKTAIEVLNREKERVSIVILDLTMPGMSGQEVLPRLRAIKPDIGVIVSSGYNEAETMRLFAGQAVSGFIQKPYTSARLAEKVKAAMAAGR